MKKPDTYIFPAIFSYEENQEISVVFYDLELATDGLNDADALANAKEALAGRLWLMEEDGDEIPEPTPLVDIKTNDNERVVLVEVFMPTIRLAKVNRSVNRTVTLPAWLNAVAIEKGINFSQLLQDAIKSQLHLD